MIVVDVNNNRAIEQKKNPQRMEVKTIPGNSRVNLRWIVKGGSKFTVRVESVKGGRASGKSE
jgi:hypothetical protein